MSSHGTTHFSLSHAAHVSLAEHDPVSVNTDVDKVVGKESKPTKGHRNNLKPTKTIIINKNIN